jgi:hypothetical protein
MPSKAFMMDALERVGWAALYAAVSVLIAVTTGMSYDWTPYLTVGLNMVKVVIARYVGNPDTAKLDKGDSA